MSGVDETKTEMFFIEVSPPQSRNVVAHLRESAMIEMAAAVYSGADVIAVVRGSASEIDATFNEVTEAEAPIEPPERL